MKKILLFFILVSFGSYTQTWQTVPISFYNSTQNLFWEKGDLATSFKQHFKIDTYYELSDSHLQKNYYHPYSIRLYMATCRDKSKSSLQTNFTRLKPNRVIQNYGMVFCSLLCGKAKL